MAFKDLEEFFDDALRLPVGGKEYVIASPDAETGLWCQTMVERAGEIERRRAAGDDVAHETLDDEQETDLYRRVLGATHDEMVADGLSWEKLKHCGMTAFLWAAGNKTSAEKYWESGGDPELLTPPTNREQRRASARASGSPTKAGGAAGSKTRNRASTNGTKRAG
jgi:hypothetical protein